MELAFVSLVGLAFFMMAVGAFLAVWSYSGAPPLVRVNVTVVLAPSRPRYRRTMSGLGVVYESV
jgi:hypothetical protein